MKYTLAFLVLLFVGRCASIRPFQKIQRTNSGSKLFLMDKENNCFLKKNIKDAIEKKLKKLSKIIIVPPQNDDDYWNSGEVKWEPLDESPEKPKRNGTFGYVIFPPLKPRPLTPIDFAMSAV